MVNSQPMPVAGRMGGNPAAAGYNMIESGVQPVRTIPNPSYPTPRPPGAPQVKIISLVYVCVGGGGRGKICFASCTFCNGCVFFDVFGLL
jgi:hypothetical protein